MTLSLAFLQDCSNRTGYRVGPLEKVVRRGEFVADRVFTSHPEIEWKLTNVRKQLEKKEKRKDIPLPGF